MLNHTNEINYNKCRSRNISAKIIKIAEKEFIVPITNCISKCISPSILQINLKFLTLSQSTKKNRNDKTNYQKFNLLPLISEIFKKVSFEQLETVANMILSQNHVRLEDSTLR